MIARGVNESGLFGFRLFSIGATGGGAVAATVVVVAVVVIAVGPFLVASLPQAAVSPPSAMSATAPV